MRRCRLRISMLAIASGALSTAILWSVQNLSISLWFTGAPLYLDSVTLRSGKLVSLTTCLYYIVLWYVLYYLTVVRQSARIMILCLILIVAAHLTMTYLGMELLTSGISGAVRNWLMR